MKGVIIAGGLGTRLYPLTWATNKHLLPVYDQPMVFYPIQTLVRAGIDEVMVVTGGPHAGHFISVLKNGKHLGLKHLEYAYQESVEIGGKRIEGGIAHALALAQDFADNQPLAVILGDNTTDADISEAVNNFKSGATIFLKKVPDPQRFGVPVFDKKDKNKVVLIEEKPKLPKSDFAVTGLYLYDKNLFDIVKNLKPSARGELEITDVNNAYLERGELTWSELNGFWCDAGSFDSLMEANNFWAAKKRKV